MRLGQILVCFDVGRRGNAFELGPVPWLGSFVAGLDDACAVIEHKGEMRGVRVDLSLLATRMIFGESMCSLAREVVALEDLLGCEGRVLEERLIGGFSGRSLGLDTEPRQSREPPCRSGRYRDT